MRQRSDRLRLASKPRPPLGIGREHVGQDFDRDVAAGRRAPDRPRPFRPRRSQRRFRTDLSGGQEGERQRSQLYGRDALARSQQNVRSRIPLSDGPWHHDGEEAAASVTNLQPLFAVRLAEAAQHQTPCARSRGDVSGYGSAVTSPGGDAGAGNRLCIPAMPCRVARTGRAAKTRGRPPHQLAGPASNFDRSPPEATSRQRRPGTSG